MTLVRIGSVNRCGPVHGPAVRPPLNRANEPALDPWDEPGVTLAMDRFIEGDPMRLTRLLTRQKGRA